jgi:hypothetical protein
LPELEIGRFPDAHACGRSDSALNTAAKGHHVDEFNERLRRELLGWLEENPPLHGEELHEAIAAIAERLAPEGSGVAGEVEEQLWREWARVEEERSTRFGA